MEENYLPISGLITAWWYWFQTKKSFE